VTFDWTEGRLTTLCTLWAAGVPSSKIGRALGCTKNVVIGKVHRLGLPGRPSPIKQGGKYADWKQDYQRRKSSQEAVQGVICAEPTRIAPEQPKPSRARVEPCSWVEGVKGSWRYCDEPSAPGRVYCHDHCAVAYLRTAASTMTPVNASTTSR